MDQTIQHLETQLEAIKALLSESNGWHKWAKTVLTAIDELKDQMKMVPSRQTCQLMEKDMVRLNQQFDTLEEKVNSIKEDVAIIRTHLDNKVSREDFTKLETKMEARAGLIGVLAGAIPAIVVILWHFIKP